MHNRQVVVTHQAKMLAITGCQSQAGTAEKIIVSVRWQAQKR